MFNQRFVLLRIPLLAVLSLICLFQFMKPLQAAPNAVCDVPSTAYTTIQSAVNDSTCETVNLTAAFYVENVVIDNRDLTIQGQQSLSTTIDGAANGTVIVISGGAIVTLTDMTITNGLDTYGGGLRVDESTAYLVRSILTGNRAVDNDVNLGMGGGVYIFDGNIEIQESLIYSNISSGSGGGLYHYSHQSVNSILIYNSMIHNNQAYISGGLDFVESDNDDTLMITNSTVYENSAFAGGGVNISGGTILTVTNSTISNNHADSYGGGLLNYGTLYVESSTIYENDQAGIHNAGGTVYINNSINAHNTADDCVNYGSISSLGYNMASDGSCNLNQLTDFSWTEPALGPLQNNGGSTETHALSETSPAIDTGDISTCIETDQRGVNRPQDGDSDGKIQCDIGAFERDGPIIGLSISTNSPVFLGEVAILSATIEEGENVTCTWEFGDGETGDGAVVSHTYPAIGTYTAIVTATNLNNSLTATVTIIVADNSNLPVANDDAAETDEDVALTIDVLANDTDGNGDSLLVDAVTQPDHGTVVNNGTNVTYTPDVDFNGSDSFSYTVSDGADGEDTATVTVEVSAVNDLPVAADDAYTITENTTVTIDLLANDIDIDGDLLTIDAVTLPTNGSVVNNGTDVTYTPDTGFNGNDGFDYTVADGNGGFDVATVTVTVIADSGILAVDIDIVSRRTQNVIWLDIQQKVPVVLFGYDMLNVAEIDLSSIGFGPANAMPVSLRYLDYNRDGHLDIQFQFVSTESGIQIDDTEACVSGMTQAGASFKGCDSVEPRMKRTPRP